MTNLYSLVQSAQTGNEIALLAIVELFQPIIRKCLKLTSYKNREDLLQELYLKVIEEIKKYDLDSVPDFWEFLKLIDLNE